MSDRARSLSRMPIRRDASTSRPRSPSIDILKKSLDAAGVNRRTFVNETGLSYEYVSRIFNSKVKFPAVRETLEKFAEVTGYPLSLEQWCASRHEASTPIAGSVEALRRSSTLGTVSLFSNNPSPFAETLDHMAPDVAEILGENALVSFQLGARKPDEEANLRALRHYDARPEDTLFIDDSRANVASAASVGMHVHHFLTIDGVPQVDALNEAIDRFAGRNG